VIDKDGKLVIDREDEIVRAVLVAIDGDVLRKAA
jgi:NAD(P) transhydrogenase subunit alpha